MSASTSRAATVVAAMVLASTAFAQGSAPAPGQVSGAELQRWVDQDGLAVGGIGLQNGCQFLAKNRGSERHLAVFCPDSMAPWTVKGEGKVVANQWCVKFRFPDGNSQDQCEEFFKVGDNAYEIRFNGVPINRVYRLVP
ncbi:hypothetical protein RAMLITH_09160 [Ramlibacter sp. RBP-2]|uniref:Alkaline proteinase inhibitor/ Outer membrane lipoprotein Omp19 domain-containing protein n=1 Tax=Ramlibacter lithotrophicus TaxID=2606681 RepID=A0A7X6DF20_9BURK|nr:hypothetical protein [Ramlibacter lithotrophicus]NKE65987.1 hypothetical protein [Ramlibacter lithotrophicus]